MEQVEQQRDPLISILAKPESERSIADVKLYLDTITERCRYDYEMAEADPRQQSWLEHYYDRWSEADDARKGLEGKAPVSKTLEYFRKEIIERTKLKQEILGDLSTASFLGDKERIDNIKGGALYLDYWLNFYEQSLKLVTNDWELKHSFRTLEQQP